MTDEELALLEQITYIDKRLLRPKELFLIAVLGKLVNVAAEVLQLMHAC